MPQFYQAWQLYPFLPMASTSVLPREGMAPRPLVITREGDVFPVYVLPLEEARARRRASGAGLTYRVYVKCRCGKDIPFGKMGQHYNSAPCKAGQLAHGEGPL